MTKVHTSLAALLYCCCLFQIHALSGNDPFLTRGRTFEALASPSGKLTMSPEIVIPDPSDPTLVLLQTDAIQKLSGRIRTQAKANSAWLSGSLSAITTFCQEQDAARGNFPGPLPVIYCRTSTAIGGADANLVEDPQALADAGASGVVIPFLDGTEIESMDQITNSDNEAWVAACQKALACGVQPIPEIVLADAMAKDMSEEDTEKLVMAVASASGTDPVSVLLTMNPPVVDDDEDDEEEQERPVSLPKVPKKLGKTIPIMGSIRVIAGENRLGIETQRFKDAGFTGVVLRSDCLPGFRMNPDLDIVGMFWSGVIGDLKSTRSKNFQFNSRNNMEKNAGVEWAKYQKSVIDDGALGNPEDAFSMVDSAAGEYKGFA